MKVLFLLVAFALVVVGTGAYLGPDDLAGCSERPTEKQGCQAADAIIAISGGDTVARAEEAIKLYQNGWAPKLVFSGAAQDKTGPSNAAVMRDSAIKAGVLTKDILIEENSRTTGQNAEETSALLDDASISSIILVTSAYHQRRASLEFGQAFTSVQVRSHPTPGDRQWSQWWWITPRGWYLAIGELAKIAVVYMEGPGN